MSAYTSTQAELLYVMPSAGSALSNTTTKTVISINSATVDPAILAANFMLPTYGVNKTLTIIARGVISTAASSPGTLTVGIYPDTTAGTPVATPLAATGALTPTTSLSSAIWEFRCDIQCTATGTSGTWLTMGQLIVSPTNSSGLSYGVGAASAVTLSTQAAYFLEMAATWGTASASNSITCNQLFVWGDN